MTTQLYIEGVDSVITFTYSHSISEQLNPSGMGYTEDHGPI